MDAHLLFRVKPDDILGVPCMVLPSVLFCFQQLTGGNHTQNGSMVHRQRGLSLPCIPFFLSETDFWRGYWGLYVYLNMANTSSMELFQVREMAWQRRPHTHTQNTNLNLDSMHQQFKMEIWNVWQMKCLANISFLSYKRVPEHCLRAQSQF